MDFATVLEQYGVAGFAIVILVIVIYKMVDEKRESTCDKEHREIVSNINGMSDRIDKMKNNSDINYKNLKHEFKMIQKKLEEIDEVIKYQKLNISAISCEVEKLTRHVGQILALLIKERE